MIDRRRATLQFVGAVAAAATLVVLLDWLTNSIDTTRFSWDFRYYSTWLGGASCHRWLAHSHIAI